MRTTVPRFTVAPPAATVPFSTFATKSVAPSPRSTVVMSHGPLIDPPASVSTARPRLLSTIRQPARAVAEEPSAVGRLPTITQPLRSTPSAVVRPTPPGQRPGSMPDRRAANVVRCPPGLIWTIVVPVPCRFDAALKFDTSTSPLCRLPVERGTTATPYGFTSPLPGTVDATTLIECSGPTNALIAPWAAAAPRHITVAAHATATPMSRLLVIPPPSGAAASDLARPPATRARCAGPKARPP